MNGDQIALACPACAARLRVPAAAAGKRVRCPKCQTAVPVAAAPAASTAEPLDDALVALASGTALESADELRSRLEAQQARAAAAAKAAAAPAAAPAGRAPRGSGRGAGTPWLVCFFGALWPRGFAGRLSFGGLLLGGAFIVYGVHEHSIRGQAKHEPQRIDCETLLKQGPGDNAHIILTDHVLLPRYIYQESLGRWEGAWVPVISRQTLRDWTAIKLGKQPAEFDTIPLHERERVLGKLDTRDFVIQMIVSFPNADREAYMDQIYDSDELHGTVFVDDWLMGLDGKQQRLLRSTYPRTDFSKVWLLVEGRTPQSAGHANLSILGGAALVLGVLGVAGWRAMQQAAG